jgi:glycosyltransferase involved in cell wall biosynthesis
MLKRNEIQLSICIPSYNGEKYLEQTLDSIINQKADGIEVLITDDSTTPETGKIVKKYIKKYPNLVRYIKNKKTLRFDRNVLNVVKNAKGKFCWLLGQDDKLLPGSLKAVISEIKKNPDASLIYCNYTRFDDILKKITAEYMVDLKEDKIYMSADDFFFTPLKTSYFKFLGTNVITMSTDVINRKQWAKYENDYKKGIGHNFIHCFAISRMIYENPKIVYLGTPQVWYRSNNHRVWPNDIWKDYNKVFIDYLIKLGYDRKRALMMRKAQSRHEKTEAAIKNPLLKHIYPIAQPIIAYARMMKEKVLR